MNEVEESGLTFPTNNCVLVSLGGTEPPNLPIPATDVAICIIASISSLLGAPTPVPPLIPLLPPVPKPPPLNPLLSLRPLFPDNPLTLVPGLHDPTAPKLPTGLGPVPLLKVPLPFAPALVLGLESENGGVWVPVVVPMPLEKTLLLLESLVAVPGLDPNASTTAPPVPGRDIPVPMLTLALGPGKANNGDPNEFNWLNVDELNAFVVSALKLGETDVEVRLVFGRENAAAMVVERTDELPGRDSGWGEVAVVKEVCREVGVGVGSCGTRVVSIHVMGMNCIRLKLEKRANKKMVDSNEVDVNSPEEMNRLEVIANDTVS